MSIEFGVSVYVNVWICGVLWFMIFGIDTSDWVELLLMIVVEMLLMLV